MKEVVSLFHHLYILASITCLYTFLSLWVFSYSHIFSFCIIHDNLIRLALQTSTSNYPIFLLIETKASLYIYIAMLKVLNTTV